VRGFRVLEEKPFLAVRHSTFPVADDEFSRALSRVPTIAAVRDLLPLRSSVRFIDKFFTFAPDNLFTK
jgi:hypothetical protein